MNKPLRLLLTIIVAGIWVVGAHATETQEVQKKLTSGEYDAIVQSKTEALQSARLSNGDRAAALSASDQGLILRSGDTASRWRMRMPRLTSNRT
jgi:hypothetical protein